MYQPLRRPRFTILLSALVAVAMIVGPSFAELIGLEASGSVALAKRKSKSAKSKRAKSNRRAKKSSGKSKKAKSKRRSKKARRRRHSKSTGHGVGESKLSNAELTKPSGDLWVYSENQHEEVRVNIYDEHGDFDDAALAKLDFEFRCRRTNEERAFDPRLYEMLSRIQDNFKGKRIHLVSGFRFQRNEGSRHYHASAMDIRIPGISIGKLRAFASSLDRGGMGIGLYPRANFVHVDFRAPGEPSYRWVDRSRRGSGSKGKGRSRRFKRNRNNS